jgi:hypothetical protein
MKPCSIPMDRALKTELVKVLLAAENGTSSSTASPAIPASPATEEKIEPTVNNTKTKDPEEAAS